MITGDEISIIYEGQLSGTDTSSVHVLKVVDEYHQKKQTKEKNCSWTGYLPDLQYNYHKIKKG